MKKSLYYLTIISVLLITGCTSNNEKVPADLINNPLSASGKNDISSLPKFKFDIDEHDFGRVIAGEILTFNFKFTNVGKSDLIITHAQASCGCTVPDFPKKPIKPGESSKISVTFNSSGRLGVQVKTITLVANTQPNTYVLTLKSIVETP